MARMAATTEADAEAFARVDAMNIVEWLDGLPEASDLLKRILTIAYNERVWAGGGRAVGVHLLSLIDFETPNPSASSATLMSATRSMGEMIPS